MPGPPRRARRVAVLGLPRSGTSWVAKTLSLGRSVTYYFEPDEALGPEYRYRYLAPGAEDPRLAAFVERTFTGGVHHEYVTAEQGLEDFLARASAQTVLVKWVKHVLAAEWLLEAQPQLRLVQVIRHPVPLALSWKARGWAMDLEGVLAQEEFLSPARGRASGPGYGQARDSKTEIHKWQGKVGKDEMRQLASTLEAFDLPFYPSLAPDVFWEDGAG